MATKRHQKFAARGAKAKGSVGLGSEFLTREEINDRYPVCEFAQKVINALKPGIDKASLYYLTECFRGFSDEMQIAMASYILGEMHYRITGEEEPEMTGVFHVDLLLLQMIYRIDHDTQNIDYNVR